MGNFKSHIPEKKNFEYIKTFSIPEKDDVWFLFDIENKITYSEPFA